MLKRSSHSSSLQRSSHTRSKRKFSTIQHSALETEEKEPAVQARHRRVLPRDVNKFAEKNVYLYDLPASIPLGTNDISVLQPESLNRAPSMKAGKVESFVKIVEGRVFIIPHHLFSNQLHGRFVPNFEYLSPVDGKWSELPEFPSHSPDAPSPYPCTVVSCCDIGSNLYISTNQGIYKMDVNNPNLCWSPVETLLGVRRLPSGCGIAVRNVCFFNHFTAYDMSSAHGFRRELLVLCRDPIVCRRVTGFRGGKGHLAPLGTGRLCLVKTEREYYDPCEGTEAGPLNLILAVGTFEVDDGAFVRFSTYQSSAYALKTIPPFQDECALVGVFPVSSE